MKSKLFYLFAVLLFFFVSCEMSEWERIQKEPDFLPEERRVFGSKGGLLSSTDTLFFMTNLPYLDYPYKRHFPQCLNIILLSDPSSGDSVFTWKTRYLEKVVFRLAFEHDDIVHQPLYVSDRKQVEHYFYFHDNAATYMRELSEQFEEDNISYRMELEEDADWSVLKQVPK